MGLMSGFRTAVQPAKGTGTNQTVRTDDYGNMFVNEGLSPNLTSALEGSLFLGRHAPAVGGTGVAMGIVVTFVDTTPALVLTNGESAGGKTYLPLYLRGRITAAGSTTTSSEIAVQVDNTNRYTSGGTSLNVAPTNPSASFPSSLATLEVGAITAAAQGSRCHSVGSAILKVAAAPLWLINDVILVTFGASTSFMHQSNAVASDAATPVVTAHVPLPACAVPPGGSLVGIVANVANATTAPSIEWEAAWIER